jgi:HlyD family secretion protein
MDIARPELARKRRRRRIAYTTVACLALAGMTLGLSRLKPAITNWMSAPS